MFQEPPGSFGYECENHAWRRRDPPWGQGPPVSKTAGSPPHPAPVLAIISHRASSLAPPSSHLTAHALKLELPPSVAFQVTLVYSCRSTEVSFARLWRGQIGEAALGFLGQDPLERKGVMLGQSTSEDEKEQVPQAALGELCFQLTHLICLQFPALRTFTSFQTLPFLELQHCPLNRWASKRKTEDSVGLNMLWHMLQLRTLCCLCAGKDPHFWSQLKNTATCLLLIMTAIYFCWNWKPSVRFEKPKCISHGVQAISKLSRPSGFSFCFIIFKVYDCHLVSEDRDLNMHMYVNPYVCMLVFMCHGWTNRSVFWVNLLLFMWI